MTGAFLMSCGFFSTNGASNVASSGFSANPSLQRRYGSTIRMRQPALRQRLSIQRANADLPLPVLPTMPHRSLARSGKRGRRTALLDCCTGFDCVVTVATLDHLRQALDKPALKLIVIQARVCGVRQRLLNRAQP